MNPLLDALNPEQREAVTHEGSPVLVLAGAGSGKTRVIAHRIAYLLTEKHVSAHNILAVTFTNKAAGEMKERVCRLLKKDALPFLWMGTFHGICARMLRRDAGYLGYGDAFTIYDDDDQRKVCAEACEKLSIKTPTPDIFRRIISSAKNRDEGPEQLAAAFDPVSKNAAKVMEHYQKALKAADAMDFDDLLLNVLDLFRRFPEREEYWRSRFNYILIDEYQDTNSVQYQIVKRLGTHGRIMVVGDDDQSIYSWRGADLKNILDFEKDYPGAHVVKLEQNYRSTGNILKVASSVIKKNKLRKEKEIFTAEALGDKVSMWNEDDEIGEGRRIGTIARQALDESKSVAVLYRTNSQSRVLEDAMRREGVPYVMIGGVRFYDRAEVKDAMAWLRLLVNPKDFRALERAAQAPRRGIGEKTLELYRSAAERLHGGDLVEALCDAPPEGVRGVKAQGMGQILRKWQWAMKEEVTLEEIVERAIVESGLEASLEAEDTDESKERLANLQEVVSAAADFATRNPEAGLKGFLEEVALVSDADTKKTDEKTAILQTLHTSKGLEYDVVCLAGCEEGLFPMLRQDGGADALEEERRLFYVGATRARKKLHIFNARIRTRFGVRDACIPSRFLDEIDPEALEYEAGSSPRRSTFSGGDLDENAPRPGGTFRNTMRRPAFPPGALRSATGDRPTFGGGTTIRSGSGGPSMGITNAPVPSQMPPKKTFPDYESEDQSSGGSFKVGMRVSHPKFGAGKVTKIHGSGNAARLDVQFGTQTKRLVAGFAGLSILG
jgi:DNA helicase II / ATP-dependent DNA helicase PcrA